MIANSLQLSSTEQNMAKEVFEVISKYGKTIRPFGLQLAHSHFPMNESEVLYETHNTESRTLSTSPVIAKDIHPSSLATSWENRDGKIVATAFCCDVDEEEIKK
jgi:hypothetical protein